MSGPSGHPGVVIAELTADVNATTLALETALENGYSLLFTYKVNAQAFAVFVQGYKGKA